MRRIICVCIALLCLVNPKLNINASNNYIFEKPIECYNYVDVNNENENLRATPAFTSCELGLGIYNNGLGISFTTITNMTASEIGVKNLVLYEKTLFGWNQIALNNYYANNTNFHSNTIVYTAAVPGKRYKVTCTHYAKINGVEYTLGNESSEITYN